LLEERDCKGRGNDQEVEEGFSNF